MTFEVRHHQNGEILAMVEKVHDQLISAKVSTESFSSLTTGEVIEISDHAISLNKPDGEVVAFALINKIRIRKGVWASNILTIYVCPNFRSRGVGYRMVKEAIQYCLAKGYTEVGIFAASSRMANILRTLAKLRPDLACKLQVRGANRYYDALNASE